MDAKSFRPWGDTKNRIKAVFPYRVGNQPQTHANSNFGKGIV